MGLKQLRTKCEARVQEVLSHRSQDIQEQGSPSMEEHQLVGVTLPSPRATTNLSPSHSRELILATSEDSSRLKMGNISIISTAPGVLFAQIPHSVSTSEFTSYHISQICQDFANDIFFDSIQSIDMQF